jgi:hypothetical protein
MDELVFGQAMHSLAAGSIGAMSLRRAAVRRRDGRMLPARLFRWI